MSQLLSRLHKGKRPLGKKKKERNNRGLKENIRWLKDMNKKGFDKELVQIGRKDLIGKINDSALLDSKNFVDRLAELREGWFNNKVYDRIENLARLLDGKDVDWKKKPNRRLPRNPNAFLEQTDQSSTVVTTNQTQPSIGLSQQSSVDVQKLKKLNTEETKLYQEQKAKIDKIVGKLDTGDLVAIGDKHGRSESFAYVTLIMKLSKNPGTFMIEGPEGFNQWTETGSAFLEKHRKWNKAAWGNHFQADAADLAKKLGWKVVTVDALNPDNPKKQPKKFGLDSLERQENIGKGVNKVLNEENGGKVLIIGTKHIGGGGSVLGSRSRENPNGISYPSLYKMTETTKKDMPKIIQKGRTKVYSIKNKDEKDSK